MNDIQRHLKSNFTEIFGEVSGPKAATQKEVVVVSQSKQTHREAVLTASDESHAVIVR